MINIISDYISSIINECIKYKRRSFLLPLIPTYLFAFLYNASQFPGWCENGDGVLFYPPGVTGYFQIGDFYLFLIMISPLYLLLVSLLRNESRTAELANESSKKFNSSGDRLLFSATFFIWLAINIGISFTLTTISISNWDPHWKKSVDGSWSGSGYCITPNGLRGCPCMD